MLWFSFPGTVSMCEKYSYQDHDVNVIYATDAKTLTFRRRAMKIKPKHELLSYLLRRLLIG